MYGTKPKKKVVDPNAPPRPNLLNHEKRLKDATNTVDQQAQLLARMQQRIDSLETKLANQTAYLSTLHHHIRNLSKG